jgi:hypothetical protein
MPDIIGYADVIGWDDIGWEDDEVGDYLDVVGARRGQRRRQGRRERRRGGGGGGEGGGGRGAGPRAREAALSKQNFGPPMTMGHDLIASAQRIEPFGLGVHTFTSAGSAVLSVVTQKPMQPLALVLSAFLNVASEPPYQVYNDGALSLVEVLDIKMGTASQLAGVQGVPGNFFRPDAVQSGQVYTPVGPGVTVSIILNVPDMPADAGLFVSAGMRVVGAQQ